MPLRTGSSDSPSRPLSATAISEAIREKRAALSRRDLAFLSAQSGSILSSSMNPAIFVSQSDKSICSTRLTPDLPPRMAARNSSLPTPFGLRTPMPVITDRSVIFCHFYGSLNHVKWECKHHVIFIRRGMILAGHHDLWYQFSVDHVEELRR